MRLFVKCFGERPRVPSAGGLRLPRFDGQSGASRKGPNGVETPQKLGLTPFEFSQKLGLTPFEFSHGFRIAL
jgi:hypothetical protein